MKKFAALAILLLAVTGCSGWERTTFQSLAASQATINQAQTDYEAGCNLASPAAGCIPHSKAAYTVINDAKATQTTVVQAMVVYENIKAAKGTATALQAQQQIVTIALAEVVPMIASIKTLYTTVTPGGAK